jgi:hypothetical protein
VLPREASCEHHWAMVMSPVRFAQAVASVASATAAMIEAMRILAPFPLVTPAVPKPDGGKGVNTCHGFGES